MLTAASTLNAINRGACYVASEGTDLVATITVDGRADTEFWTPEERPSPLSTSDRRRMVAASILDDAWVTVAAASPGPWFVAVEAVLCFLPELEVRRALGQVAALAAAGPTGSEVAFDTWGTWMRGHQDDHDALRVMDARVHRFCDSPTEIEAFGLGLRSTETVGLMDAPAELVDLLAPEDRAVLDAARHDPQASPYRLHRFGIGPQAQAGTP